MCLVSHNTGVIDVDVISVVDRTLGSQRGPRLGLSSASLRVPLALQPILAAVVSRLLSLVSVSQPSSPNANVQNPTGPSPSSSRTMGQNDEVGPWTRSALMDHGSWRGSSDELAVHKVTKTTGPLAARPPIARPPQGPSDPDRAVPTGGAHPLRRCPGRLWCFPSSMCQAGRQTGDLPLGVGSLGHAGLRAFSFPNGPIAQLLHDDPWAHGQGRPKKWRRAHRLERKTRDGNGMRRMLPCV